MKTTKKTPGRGKYRYGTKPEGWRFLELGEVIQKGDYSYYPIDSI
jgi:hypothetical protein